jgi:hypothetical protein
MKNTLHNSFFINSIIQIFCVLIFSTTVIAGTIPEAGIVVMAAGETSAQGADKTLRALSRRSSIFVGDKLSTGTASQMQLRMKDGALISLGPDAALIIKAYADDAAGDKKDAAVLSLVQGGLRTISGSIDKSTYRMETPIATLGIRGTVFDVYVKDSDTTVVILREGGVDVTGDTGVVQKMDAAGLAVVVERGKAPSQPGAIPPEVRAYLRSFMPEVPDDATWQQNGDGSVSFNLGEDVINLMNTPPPTQESTGEIPGIQEIAPVVTPEVDPCIQSPWICNPYYGGP